MPDTYPSCRFKPFSLTRAKIVSFPLGQKSVLERLHFVPEFNLADKALLYKVNVARDVVRKKREKEPNHRRAPAIVRYDEKYLDENTAQKTLNTGKNAEQGKKADKWRHKTKHRTVTSDVQLYADGFGRVYSEPTVVTVTTGCAPNLMGTSQSDEKKFLNGDRLKNPDKFKNAYKKLFLELLSAQDESGVNICVLPFIGGDLYMNRIGSADKSFARRCAIEALHEVLEDFQFQNIKEVIFAAPEKASPGQKSENNTLKLVQSVFSNYTGTTNFTVANVDMLNTCFQAKKFGKVGIINAGSDRTLGGAYKHTEAYIKQRHKIYSKSPAEELLFNLSDAAQSQAIDQGAPVIFKPYNLDYLRLDKEDIAASTNDRTQKNSQPTTYVFTFVNSDEEQEDDIFEMEGIYTNIPVAGMFAHIKGHFVNLLSFSENTNQKITTYSLRFDSEKDAQIFAKHLQSNFPDEQVNLNKKRITINTKVFEFAASEFEHAREIFDSPFGDQLKQQLIANFNSSQKHQKQEPVAEKTRKTTETRAGEQKQKEEKSEIVEENLPTSQQTSLQATKFSAKKAFVETIKITEKGFVELTFSNTNHFNNFQNHYLKKFSIDHRTTDTNTVSLKLNNYQKICNNDHIKFNNFIPYHNVIDYKSIFKKIDLRIKTLKAQQKDSGCFSFFNKRKEQKIKGLEELKKSLKHHPELPIKNHIAKIKKNFPDIDAGIFSRQTKNMLDNIQHLTSKKFSV